MKAWRFYGFGDLRLDEIARPELRPGHVLAELLCVQPSVIEAQLAFGIPTLAYMTGSSVGSDSEVPLQLMQSPSVIVGASARLQQSEPLVF